MTRAEADQKTEEEDHHLLNHLLAQILQNRNLQEAVAQILLSQRNHPSQEDHPHHTLSKQFIFEKILEILINALFFLFM